VKGPAGPVDPDPAVGETLDLLAGSWRILQLRRGHRFSSDDLLTAWTAARSRPDALDLLDLGSGIGSVGLLALWRMAPAARLRTVEIQRISHDLAQRTVALNGLQDRVTLVHGDLRDQGLVPASGRHDLVTGSPPYIPLGKGAVSPHPQRAGARMELEGSVFDYCEAAARSLAPGPAARFCFCHQAADPRPLQAIEAAGLTLLARQEVVFRAGRPPLIALFTCGREGLREDPEPFTLRHDDGRWTAQYLEMRREMGATEFRARPRR